MNMAGSNCSLKEVLKLQLSEIDMLQSMFPNNGEFEVDDPGVIADVNDYVENKSLKIPSRLDFALHLQIDEGIKLELSCSFPHDYPFTEPEVFVRSQQLDRTQQHQLNEDLLSYVNKLEKGELCVYSIIQWLQDNGSQYVITKKAEPSPEQMQCEIVEKDLNFARYWIYSHHIYNKMKRRSILDFAKELELTGFCLPGKPGIICVEGTEMNCAEFWQKVKHMNWKKILCKMKEIVEIKNKKLEHLRRFNSFEEIAFEVRKGPGREYHMDMGEFYKYLENHRSGYVFKNYFGVDGKPTAS